MSLLDQLGSVLGNAAQGGGTGGQADLLKAVLGMLNHGQGAGLGSLVSAFQQNGLGHIFDSWVSSGSNLPISTTQLTQVLGQDKLSQLAQQSGLPHGDVASALTQLLPKLIDHASPQGQLPAGNELGGLLGSLAGKLFA
ncbi:MAG: YidB family protein [Steroidobacteraceae bacterium]